LLLVLGAIVLFIVIGVGSRRYDWRQQTLIVVVAMTLAAVQFRFPGVL